MYGLPVVVSHDDLGTPHIDKMQAGWTEMEDHRAYQDDHG